MSATHREPDSEMSVPSDRLLAQKILKIYHDPSLSLYESGEQMREAAEKALRHRAPRQQHVPSTGTENE